MFTVVKHNPYSFFCYNPTHCIYFINSTVIKCTKTVILHAGQNKLIDITPFLMKTMGPPLLLPIVIWDNAPFCRLVCAVEPDGVPVAHLSIWHGIQDAEYRAFLETHLVFRRCLVVKMRSVEAKLKMTIYKIFFFIKCLNSLEWVPMHCGFCSPENDQGRLGTIRG